MQKIEPTRSTTENQNQIQLVKIKDLIGAGDFDQALELADNVPDRSGEAIACKAMIYFLTEKYDLAVHYYQQCRELDPHNEEWKMLLKQAEANVISEIHKRIPDIYLFADIKKEEPESTMQPVTLDLPVSYNHYAKRIVGQVSGSIFTYLVNGINWLWGKMVDYRDDIWTNWYRRPIFWGVLTLGYMRTRLYKNNLISTYPENALIGFLEPGYKIPESAKRYRTANGSWNNLQNPLEGAARTRFLRNVPIEKNAPNAGNLLFPNPRQLSLTFLTRKGKMKEVPFLNMLSVAWIQFQNHDWISYGEPMMNEMHEIPLAKDDPARIRYWQTKLMVGKTQRDPWRREDEVFEETYLNECTHWWDGSQIYGSDQKTQDWLRSGQQGKLRIQSNGLLPRDKNGIEETGFVRNWWVGLSMMHTLFVREHNAICDHLRLNYPSWNDEQLFQTARLTNAALMAKIHSMEWNAAINPNKALYQGIQSNWYGLLSGWMNSSEHKKTVTDITVRNPEFGGIMGNTIEKHGCPFGLTQEFVEVYRMHSLLPETLAIRDLQGDSMTDLPMVATRQAASGKCIDRFGMDNLFYSLGKQNPGQLVLNNYPSFMQEMSIPGNPVYDLGAVDILRARERGVPRYNAFRRAMGLNPIRKFEDLTSDPIYVQLLKEAYQDNVELIDLMIGALAEEHRPTNFAFGETIFQIFLLNATRRLHADRFFTDCYSAEYYTQEGLNWIDQNNLRAVLLRHFPALAKTGLSNIKNAFEPWDDGEYLEAERHPLRGFERSLKKDPWRGDSYK